MSPPGESEAAEAWAQLLALKGVPRRGWLRHAIPRDSVESVADHSYGTALLGWLLCPAGLDRGRVLELALLHDLAEVLTGDITPADRVDPERKRTQERAALAQLLEGSDRRQEALELWAEYAAQETQEARFVKAVDKLDMALQSRIYERQTGSDLAEFRHSARPSLEPWGLAAWMDREERP